MKIRILATLAIAALVTGCSDGDSKIRGQFVAGCVQGGAPKSICRCVFDRLSQTYSIEQLEQISRSPYPSQQVMEDSMRAALICSS